MISKPAQCDLSKKALKPTNFQLVWPLDFFQKCSGNLSGPFYYNQRCNKFFLPKVGGPDQFSCQILKFLAGSLATPGQKKVVLNPNFTPTQESPTLTPVPPLAKIGHQEQSHGGGSISSNMVLTKKCLRQQITYPLGTTLTPAILLKRCFS